MANSDRDLQNAVRELRTRLGMNQMEFARSISRSVNTVSRYESQIAPKAEALVPYAALAIRSGFTDLSQIFRAAILEELGSDLEFVISWHPDGKSVPRQSEEEELVETIRAFVTAKNLHPIEEIARNSLKETFAYYRARLAGKKRKTPALL